MPAKLSTHVLDLTRGAPAPGMRIELRRPGGLPPKIAVTNADGRTDEPLLGPEEMAAGSYEIVFAVRAYFAGRGVACPFLEEASFRFDIADPSASHHVPLLVTPWSAGTYRGS
jgi:5-hydroxyisourate hydrolase